MKNSIKIVITATVIILIGAVLWLKNAKFANNTRTEQKSELNVTEKHLPRVLELGSTTCVPCKMMEKVLESLRHGYSDSLKVDFIDVTININAGKKHNIKLIPTQIFFNAAGKEIFRHEGFFPEKDIIAKFAELGITLKRAKLAKTEQHNEKAADSSGVISAIFATLTEAVSGTALLALSAAFIWGVLSILLSPCHLASIPLIVGFINEQKKMTPWHAFILSNLFSFGILITITLIGVITALSGHMLGDVGSLTNYIVSFVFLVVGLNMLGIIPMSWSGADAVKMNQKGLFGALILGLIFGIAIGPCTFAYMAPMLAVTFKASSANSMMTGVGLLVLYGIGHCSVIVFAGTFTEWIQKYLKWNERSGGAFILKKICATLIIAGGLYMIYLA
jgi:cytochrome c-type biogenesis protein